jgi:hypothetical protein
LNGTSRLGPIGGVQFSFAVRHHFCMPQQRLLHQADGRVQHGVVIGSRRKKTPAQVPSDFIQK